MSPSRPRRTSVVVYVLSACLSSCVSGTSSSAEIASALASANPMVVSILPIVVFTSLVTCTSNSAASMSLAFRRMCGCMRTVPACVSNAIGASTLGGD